MKPKNASMYKDVAHYYDLIYSWKDYEKESKKIITLIDKYKKSKGKDLLEVGCGTGQHLKYLKRKFHCTGLDLNKGILAVAKKRHKDITFRQANMITFSLKKKFNVITTLFSAIGYVKTYKNLERTIKNFSKHLKPGGVVIIEPWFTKENFTPRPTMSTYESEDSNLKIARVGSTTIKGNITHFEMHFLVSQKRKPIQHFVDTHELGLFSTDKALEFMRKAGLRAKFLKNGLMRNRGLFVGVKE